MQKLNQLNCRRREIHQDKDLDKMLYLYLYSKYLDIWTFLSVFWLVHVDFCRIVGTFIPPCLINKIYLRLIFLNYYKMTSNFGTMQSIHSNVRYLGEEIHFDLIFKCFKRWRRRIEIFCMCKWWFIWKSISSSPHWRHCMLLIIGVRVDWSVVIFVVLKKWIWFVSVWSDKELEWDTNWNVDVSNI